MHVLAAFLGGLRASWRAWYAWLPFYLGNALIAFIMSLPLFGWLAERLDLRAWAEQLSLSQPLNLNLGVDLIGVWQTAQQSGESIPSAQLILPIVAGIPLQALVYAFFAGGYLEALRSGEHKRTYWVACRHWFLPFAGLSVFTLLSAMVLLLLGLILFVLGQTLAYILAGVLVTLALFVPNGIGEFGRIQMVVADRRDPVTALAAGLRFILRHLATVLGIGFLLLVCAALIGILGTVASLVLPSGLILVGILVNQIRALFESWYKALRLSTQMRLYEQAPEADTNEIFYPAPAGQALHIDT